MNAQLQAAWDGFLTRLLASPGTTIGALCGTLGQALEYAGIAPRFGKLMTGLGMALLGFNAVSHGFMAKQQAKTDTVLLTKADVSAPPPTKTP